MLRMVGARCFGIVTDHLFFFSFSCLFLFHLIYHYMSYKRISAISFLISSVQLANAPPLQSDFKSGVILFRIVFRPIAGTALSEVILAGSFQGPGRGVFFSV